MSTEALEKAVAGNDLQAVRAALVANPALALARTSAGVSALMLALYQGRELIAIEMAKQADALPLFEASALGRLDRVRELLAEDSTAAAAWSADGFQALHLAAFFARLPVLDYLLEQGADPNVRAQQPAAMTALHSAAASRQAELVARLLEAGADPNLQQGGGFTALMSAALHGNVAMIEHLLRAGARRELRADDGRSALDMAEQNGHQAAVALLGHAAEPAG